MSTLHPSPDQSLNNSSNGGGVPRGSGSPPAITLAPGASQELLAQTFAADPRIHFSTVTRRWALEDEDGNEWEYDALKGVWVQVVDEELLRLQQAAYSVPGVDEEAPAAPILKRLNKKRKEPEDYTSATTPQAGHSIKRGKGSNNNNNGNNSFNNNNASTNNAVASSSNTTTHPTQRKSKNTAVYVTRLPPDTTPEELAARFARCGVLEEDDDGDPKIKLYARDDGSFSGEALVVYFKEESVALAVAMLDEAELRIGEPSTTMSVSQAEFGHKGEVGGGGGAGAAGEGEHKPRKTIDKKRATKRIGRMQKKLEDWGSDDDFGPSPDAASSSIRAAGAAGGVNNKNARVVVLKHMFTLDQLQEDASLILDLKEDVREECSQLGEVTNVVLYDEEPDGVMTVKFREPISAQACVLKMQNRFFDGRRVEASLYTGKQRFKRSGPGGGEAFGDDIEGEDDEAEKQRLDEFANWLMTEGD
ncbi:uncharacterized protein FOMMEDRAFT_85466 [Fomitiporia mediterranea MF3/22]|uniref:uncharacterized protein n=1 Tax=Fomitiporia mediterranea (strain MF3/22) TaxID=694068 RepID=UPI000440824C|nr:uncharacterized protein FOMMEDRAFT_85466 [Fomitiporia mediterranea MF3/22]EJD03292.1 hypothetical protein FOMMEDRAFT_85466 [Fomitiporia mediterranea MF3/22]